MTQDVWLGKVRDNKDMLRDFIADYHPASRITRQPAMPITAALAEAACDHVRQDIRQREEGQALPVERFDTALEAGDWNAIYSLLSSAWFGVPESTSCWQIDGFSLACDLMDDPPETDEPNEE